MNTDPSDPETWDYAACGCGAAERTDRGGNVAETTYDANERVKTLKTTTANGTVVAWQEYAYDAADNVTTTCDALSNCVERVYNAAGEQIAAIDPLGRVTHFYRDAFGRQYLTDYPDGSTSSNTYDAASRVIKTARYAAFGAAAPLTSHYCAFGTVSPCNRGGCEEMYARRGS